MPDGLPHKLFYVTSNDKLDGNLGRNNRESRSLSVCGIFADFLQLLPGLFLDKYYRQQHLAVETPEEKETRLQRMRDTLAAETPEERQGRLQRMSTNQHERLAVETPEERELRLEQYSTRYRNNSLCSHNSHCYNSVPFKPRCINFM